VLVLLVAPLALAHDPGQGEDAGSVAMRVTVIDGRATLTAELGQDVCRATEPLAVVARRGGETLRAALAKRGCRLQGALHGRERGRWFVYVEMRRVGAPSRAGRRFPSAEVLDTRLTLPATRTSRRSAQAAG
jgi:hypothetical protein